MRDDFLYRPPGREQSAFAAASTAHVFVGEFLFSVLRRWEFVADR